LVGTVIRKFFGENLQFWILQQSIGTAAAQRLFFFMLLSYHTHPDLSDFEKCFLV